jgi:hypothetical protein
MWLKTDPAVSRTGKHHVREVTAGKLGLRTREDGDGS